MLELWYAIRRESLMLPTISKCLGPGEGEVKVFSEVLPVDKKTDRTNDKVYQCRTGEPTLGEMGNIDVSQYDL